MAATTTPTPGLASLRWLLFLFFGGIGGLLPFLPLHARVVGLTLEEARIVSIASPLIAFIGPAIAGPLFDYFTAKKKSRVSKDVKLDNNGGIRLTLASTVLLALIFYCLLFAVPRVQRFEPRQPAVSFTCTEKGASLIQERCNKIEGCYQYPGEKKGEIRLSNCKFNCSSTYYSPIIGNEEDNSLETEVNTTTANGDVEISTEMSTEVNPVMILEPDLDKFFGAGNNDDQEDDDDTENGSGEEASDWVKRQKREDTQTEPPPPHICSGISSKRMCSVFVQHSPAVQIGISVKHAYGDKDFCHYPLGGHISCRIPNIPKEPSATCRVVCELEDAFISGSVLQQSQCTRTSGDPFLTISLYFVLRTLGDLFTAVSISFLIGATLSAVHIRLGKEFFGPSLAYALLASLAGYLQSSDLSPLRTDRFAPYLIGIACFGMFSVICVFILIFSTEMPIGPPDWWSSSRHIRFRHKSEFCGLLLVLTLLGMLWGPQFNHVPWHFSGTPGLELYVGCSVGVGALLSLLFVWKADFIIDYCGYSNILITSFTVYILRYIGLLSSSTPWVLLITGGLEVFTLSLMFFSTILYIRHLVPKHLTFTAQSLGFAAHFCLGNGLGCLLATLLSPSEAEVKRILESQKSVREKDSEFDSPYHLLYCTGAVFAAIVASVYFIVYHFCLKKKCLAPTYRKTNVLPPLVQESAGNGTYTPLRVFRNGRQQ